MCMTKNVMKTLPLLGWCVLVPVALLALLRTPLEAGLAAGLVGGLASASGVWSRTLRALVPVTAATSTLSWGASAAGAAWLAKGPWLVVALPLAMVVAVLPLRLIGGAPRFVNNPLARTQQPWLAVVHTARLGGDLMTTAVLATASTSVALALCGHFWAAAAGAGFVVAVLTFGWASLRRATGRAGQGRLRRVAAVVVDGKPPEHGELTGLWPVQSPEYRDVEGTLTRYWPHVEEAARQGAKVIVLPEVSLFAENGAPARWCAAVEDWARALDVAIVAPYFDAAIPLNTLAVIDKSGVVAHYQKQHPARGAEPPRLAKMEVGPDRLATGAALSTAICVDLDYSDTAHSARRAGTLLAAPSNDWFGGFEVLHHRSAVWAAVMGGVPIVRSTGHGISSIYDGAGHVLNQQCSADGPVVLVADVRG